MIRNIKLSELGISSLKTRKAATDAFILEIAGEDHSSKADNLSARMKDVIDGREGYKIGRPLKTVDVRVKGLDCSSTVKDVVDAVAELTGCNTTNIHTGDIRMTPRGQSTLWLRLPIVTMKKIAKESNLVVGWNKTSIEVLAVLSDASGVLRKDIQWPTARTPTGLTCVSGVVSQDI